MPNDTYSSTSAGRTGSSEMMYDPVKREWVEVSPNSSNVSNNSSGSGADVTTSTSSQTVTTVVDTNPTSKVDSKGEADKEYIEIEFNTLTGDLNITSTEKSIRIKVNDTVRLEGLGKNLSGLYFVSAVKRTLTKDNGYTHSLSLIKTGFGSSLKTVVTVEPEPPRLPEVVKDVSPAKVGDKVKIVGDNAVYSNAHDGVKVPTWVKQKTLTVDAVSSDGTRVRLMPIFSWTYVKFIQKV